jgi:hypothetical protein
MYNGQPDAQHSNIDSIFQEQPLTKDHFWTTSTFWVVRVVVANLYTFLEEILDLVVKEVHYFRPCEWIPTAKVA